MPSKAARANLTRERALAAILETTGQERLIPPDEVAAAVLDLCREEMDAVTGETILLGTRSAT